MHCWNYQIYYTFGLQLQNPPNKCILIQILSQFLFSLKDRLRKRDERYLNCDSEVSQNIQEESSSGNCPKAGDRTRAGIGESETAAIASG